MHVHLHVQSVHAAVSGVTAYVSRKPATLVILGMYCNYFRNAHELKLTPMTTGVN